MSAADFQPINRQIADGLRQRIMNGEYQPGDRIPGENWLMEEHGVSRTTARAAIAVLRDEGLITVRRGAGSFVQRAESVSIPISQPATAAKLLRSALAPEDLRALVEALAAS